MIDFEYQTIFQLVWSYHWYQQEPNTISEQVPRSARSLGRFLIEGIFWRQRTCRLSVGLRWCQICPQTTEIYYSLTARLTKHPKIFINREGRWGLREKYGGSLMADVVTEHLTMAFYSVIRLSEEDIWDHCDMSIKIIEFSNQSRPLNQVNQPQNMTWLTPLWDQVLSSRDVILHNHQSRDLILLCNDCLVASFKNEREIFTKHDHNKLWKCKQLNTTSVLCFSNDSFLSLTWD